MQAADDAAEVAGALCPGPTMSPRSPVSGRGCPVFQHREDVNGDEAKKSGPVVLVEFTNGYSDQFSAKEAIANHDW